LKRGHRRLALFAALAGGGFLFAAILLIREDGLARRAVESMTTGRTPVRPPGPFPIVLEDWSCGFAKTVSNSNPAIVTCDTAHNLPATTAHGRRWIMMISGASGRWAALNGTHEISILDAQRFSVAVDTRQCGPWRGQKSVSMIRANHEMRPLWRANHAGHTAVTAEPLAGGGGLEVNVPDGCSTTANQRNCYSAGIESFVVDGGVARIRLKQPLRSHPPGFTVAPGREIHFRNLNLPSLNSLAYSGRGPDRPHTIAWINNEFTELKVAVTAPDGRYMGGWLEPAQVVICPRLMFVTLFLARTAGGNIMPLSTASEYAKQGPLPPGTNRLYFWVRWGKDIPRLPTNSYNATIGTYAKSPDDPDPRAERFHFYHTINPNYYGGRWMRIVVNNQPQHLRGASGNGVVPLNPMIHGWHHLSSPGWDGRRAEYLSNLTSFYLDTHFGAADFAGQTVTLGPVVFDRIEDEPDAYVSSLTAVYSPRRMGARGPGYEVGFYAARLGRDGFDIRYSGRSSLKVAGFSAGREGGRLESHGSPYNHMIWYSPEAKEEERYWVAIRPRMRIAGISRAGHSPMVVSLYHDPAMRDGDHVDVVEVSGLAGAGRRAAPASNKPGRTWTLGSGLLGITVRRSEATVSLSGPHGLLPGEVVEIFNSPDRNLGRIAWQRFYTIQAAPSPSTFTVRTEGVADGEYQRDAADFEPLAVRSCPALIIEGDSGGVYGGSGCANRRFCDGGGYVVSSEEHRNFTEIAIFPFDPAKPVREQLSGPGSSSPRNWE
jgi:hypothetical protein